MTADCVVECPPNDKSQRNGDQTTPGDHLKNQKICAKMRAKSTLFVVLLILGVSCIFAYLSNRYYEQQTYCMSTLCKRSEKYLAESINFSVDPCDNFYEFACGNWKRRHPIPSDTMSIDLFTNIQTRTAQEIARFLEQANSNKEPKAVHEARTLFKSCLSADKLNESNGFQQIAEILEQIDLPVVPSFTDKSENFSWSLTSILSKKLIGQNFFIEFSISGDPKNHTVKKLTITKPSSTGPLSLDRFSKRRKRVDSEQQCDNYLYENFTQYLTEKEDLVDDEYYKYIKYIVQFVYNTSELEWNEEREDNFNELMIQFMKFDDEITHVMDYYYEKSPMIPEYISIEEMQNFTDTISECNNISPIIDWRSYFETMFDDIEEVKLDFEDRDNIILILNEDYLMAIFKLLSNTPPYVIEFYMWWKTVYGIIPFTTSILNKEQDRYFTEITGNKKKPRDLYCADIANEALGFAVAYYLTYDDSVKENIVKITEMVNSIHRAFLEEIGHLDWMDEETRQISLKKLKAMKKSIGYPEWMNNPEEYDSYYGNITMVDDDFFNNILRENQRQFYLMLKCFHDLENEEDDGWSSNPLDVNAFNNIEENEIMIPAGIFPFPFYQLGLESLNYGAIGSVIGHELTHGFDNTGKEYDHKGHLNAWWTNETRMEYEERAECFIDHYDKFNFTGIEDADNETWVNGAQTLDENIADNGGLRIAFYAYKNYVMKKGEEKLLRALKKYSNEQLFFLAFASTWCEHGTRKSLKISLTDEHSPNFVRVLATLVNSKEFAETWNCPVGSPMNPTKNKCQIW